MKRTIVSYSLIGCADVNKILRMSETVLALKTFKVRYVLKVFFYFLFFFRISVSLESRRFAEFPRGCHASFDQH